jgi:hypothetical protein
MGVRTLLHSTSEHNARSDSDQLGTKKRRPREAFPQPDMAHSLLDANRPWPLFRGRVRLWYLGPWQ